MTPPPPTIQPTPSTSGGGTPTAAGTLLTQDTFARNSNNGWGTSSDGNFWTLWAGSASPMSVSNGKGRVKGSADMAVIRATLGSVPTSDGEVVARYNSGDYSNDAGHLVLRLSDATDYYVAGLDSPNGTPEINIMKVVGGGQTRVAAISYDATNGTSYWQRVAIQGGTITVKVWKDGTAEPPVANLTWTDSSPLPAGLDGIESWDDGQGWFMDDFTAATAASPTIVTSGNPLAGGLLFAIDTFAGRTVSGGWGNGTDGQAWTVQSGDATKMNVAVGRGLVSGTHDMSTLRATLGTHVSGDAEVVVRYTSGDYNNDDGHVLLRFSDAGDYYVAGLDSPNGKPEVNVMRKSGGKQSRVASTSFAATNGTSYWERVRIQGGVVSVRIWKDGTAEPPTWTLTYTDHSPLPAGTVGMESWDSGHGWYVDHFSAGDLVR